jgi:hypothetical protein
VSKREREKEGKREIKKGREVGREREIALTVKEAGNSF